MRQKWIDICKGIGIILVVVGHVIVRNESEGFITIGTSILCSMIYSFHVPFLFILSGICFSLAYINDFDCLKTDRIKNAIVNNIMLYIIWSVMFILYKYLFSIFTIDKVNIKDILFIPVIAQSGLWYIYILIFAYMLMLIVYKNAKLRFALAFILLLACLAIQFIHNDTFEKYTIFRAGYILFFFLGGEFGKISKKEVEKQRHLNIFIGLTGVSSAFGLFYEFYIYRRFVWSDVPIVGMIVACTISFFFIALNMKIEEKSNAKNTLVQYIGKHSIEIYILHIFIFTPIIKVMNTLRVKYEIVIIVTSILCVFIPLILSMIMSKLKMWTLFFKPYTFLTDLRRMKDNK